MYKDILLAIDLTDDSSWNKALPTAIEYCQGFGATLHMLSVVPDFGMTVVGQYFPKDFEKQAVGRRAKNSMPFPSATCRPASRLNTTSPMAASMKKS